MSELAKIEAEIIATKDRLQQLEQRACELRKEEKQAALEEIWRKMAEMGLSASDLARAKLRKPRTFRKYYLLDGVKYPVKPGRLPPQIASYKASGGNVADITFTETD